VSHLNRDLAPFSDGAWDAVDDQVRQTLRQGLAARRLVEFSGPHGWEWLDAHLVRTETGPAGEEGVHRTRRIVDAAAELRVPFVLELKELQDADRGRTDPDLDAAIGAARVAALAEDHEVFDTLVSLSPHDPVKITTDYQKYPSLVAKAVAILEDAGIDGPYGLALGPRCHTGVIETTEHGGYPVFQHITQILGGPIVRAGAVDGALVVSMRGGDFRLGCGQDFSVGYLKHDATTVHLYIEESISVRVLEPAASVALRY
jgi:uncharacterized linocin/CFP29 family protein